MDGRNWIGVMNVFNSFQTVLFTTRLLHPKLIHPHCQSHEHQYHLLSYFRDLQATNLLPPRIRSMKPSYDVSFRTRQSQSQTDLPRPTIISPLVLKEESSGK